MNAKTLKFGDIFEAICSQTYSIDTPTISRVMWGVMGHLRVFHCREATDEVEE
jgi:hypothetical protein